VAERVANMRGALGTPFWIFGKGGGGGKESATVQLFERAMVVSNYAFHCDNCTISNHSAAICRRNRMSPTIKSTGVDGSLWGKI